MRGLRPLDPDQGGLCPLDTPPAQKGDALPRLSLTRQNPAHLAVMRGFIVASSAGQEELLSERCEPLTLAHVIRDGLDAVLHVQVINQLQALLVAMCKHFTAQKADALLGLSEKLFVGLHRPGCARHARTVNG